MTASANLPWWSPRRPWGFRFSRSDLIITLTGVLATIWLFGEVPELAILLPFVLGHFFLFCNVFRVGEARELCWSVTFILNVLIWILSGHSSWSGTLVLQLAVTSIVIIRTLRSSDYHGILCQRINPLGYRPEFRVAGTSLLRRLLRRCRVPSSVIDVLQGRSHIEAD